MFWKHPRLQTEGSPAAIVAAVLQFEEAGWRLELPPPESGIRFFQFVRRATEDGEALFEESFTVTCTPSPGGRTEVGTSWSGGTGYVAVREVETLVRRPLREPSNPERERIDSWLREGGRCWACREEIHPLAPRCANCGETPMSHGAKRAYPPPEPSSPDGG